MIKPFKTFISSLLFPLTLTLGTSAMIIGAEAAINPETIAMIIAVTTIIIVHTAERLHPFRKEWNKNKGDVKADLTSLAVILAALEPLMKLVTTWATSVALIIVGSTYSLSIFPTEWPVLAQLAIFAVFAEFGRYWIHRASHTRHHLWRVHASHHSADRLYQFNGYRIHPINHLWNYFLGQFPLVLLGASEEIIMLYFVFSSITAAFQHSNIDSKNGLLNYIFSTNELHRWHHTTDKTVGHKNFGSVIIVWDIIFGSYYSGKDNVLDKVGLMSPKNYPINNFWLQMVAPFCWNRCVTNEPTNKEQIYS